MWRNAHRANVQSAVRVAALVVVVAWLFSDAVRAWVPVWVPLCLLLAAEIEFVVRGRREGPRSARPRVPPGPEDADLGFGEIVEDEDGIRYLPPPARPRRAGGRWLGWVVGAAVAALVVGLAVRSDRAATWGALSPEKRARAEARFTAEASRIADRAVRVRCDEGYAFTGAGSDTLGIAFPGAHLAYLDPTVCRSLYDLAFGGGRSGAQQTVDAVIVLAHEAVHLGGERREGVTECLALQEAGPLAVRLGLGSGTARRALRTALDQRLAERNVIRAAYALPAGCRDGGSLDRRPDDPRFPF
jgi:hypothetical protein